MNAVLAGSAVKMAIPRRTQFDNINKQSRPISTGIMPDIQPEPKSSTSVPSSPKKSPKIKRPKSPQLLNMTTEPEPEIIPKEETCFKHDWIRPDLLADTEVHVQNDAEVTPISARSIKASEIRNTKINWSSYLERQQITQDQFDCILILTTYPKDQRSDLLIKYGADCMQFLSEMLGSFNTDLPVYYLLILIDDLLEEDRTRVMAVHACAKSVNKNFGWNLFFPFLTRPDDFMRIQSSRIIVKLACWSPVLMNQADLLTYFISLKQQLKSNVNDYKESSVRCLQMLLRIDEYKLAFIDADGISTILSLLNIATAGQLQYQLVFCLWCCSLTSNTASRLHSYKVIPGLAGILANAHMEKVIRIILSTLRNLLEKPENPEIVRDNALLMVHNKVTRTLELLRTKTFRDPDLNEDLQYLVEKLEHIASEFSSFDEYESELKSGNLEWSPVHKSESFWRENVMKFNDGNHQLLKILCGILEESKDPVVLSVAVHDLGEYARYYPRGKRTLEKLGAKDNAMKLLSHEDPTVRYYALLALQKILVHSWAHLEKDLTPQ